MAELDKYTVLENVKLDLDIADNIQDDLLLLLIRKVIDHFKLAYSVDDVETIFSFVIEDCTIKRFNRRGSEGAKAESIEGHSVTYDDTASEFEPYDDLIRSKLSLLETKECKGGIYIL
ncbi:TPA: phage head-tail connector protein [Streptococcus suis]|nr:phage head-tail connector protein [Streptococcus suis]